MSEEEIQHIKQRFGIIGASPALVHAIRIAVQVAPTDMSVVITGESGSGKESFSKIIHSLSPRKHGQFIAINCGAIPEGTIYSELFGHEKGAFTGAVDARKGYFEVVDGGTIFLDEIGEMPLDTQAMLLRVLENGEFIRMGGNKVQKTDVRVIAATNVNLAEAVREHKFREDLYYRLNTVPIYVPPLRERGEDVLLLFRKFAVDFAEKYKVQPIKYTPEAAELLKGYPFPGNIRQLKNLTEQISALELSREIDAHTLSKYLPRITPKQSIPAFLGGAENTGKDSLNERELLYKVLFDMRRDVTELKKLVFQLLHQGDFSAAELLRDHRELFTNLPDDDAPLNSPNTVAAGAKLLPYNQPKHAGTEDTVVISKTQNLDDEDEKIHEITYEEAADESLSIEQKEKELIIKALRKNKNKRKNAAQDLGISERTLYRKIKHYDIDA